MTSKRDSKAASGDRTHAEEPILDAETQAALDASWEKNKEALKRLAEL